MKILIIPHTGKTENVPRRADYLAESLRRQGHTVYIYELSRQGVRFVPVIGTAINTRDFLKLFRRVEPDLVISQSYYQLKLTAEVLQKSHVIYEVVDDHAAYLRDLKSIKRFSVSYVEAFIREHISEATLVTAVSSELADKYSCSIGREIHVSPNGVNIDEWRITWDRMRIEDPKLIYIGNHGPWSGVSFLLKMFERLLVVKPNSSLTIVGPISPNDRRNLPGVQWTGPLSKQEVIHQASLANVGVIPFELTPFTHAAFPIKVLEYGAAMLPVVSTPLRTLERADLPWVTLVRPNVDDWVKAILSVCERNWNNCDEDALQDYDWDIISNRILSLI